MAARIEQTVDGDYMVLVNGFQWGGDYDRSGAGNATFKTPAEAIGAYRDSGNTDRVIGPDYHTIQTFNEGDRVELCPSLDLWMRGARFATVIRTCRRTGIIVARSDNSRVRKLIRVSPDRLRHVR